MKELIERALRVAKENGATYADVRVVSTVDQQIKVKKGELVGLTDEESKGFGVRVIADGAWGFSSSYQLTPDQVERVAKEAVAIAKASAKVAHDPVRLAKVDIHVDDVQSGIVDDSRNVPFKKRIAHALEADASMDMQGIVSHSVNLYNRFQEKFFASSEGAFIRQEDVKSGCGMMSFASDGKTYARRSYPAGQFGDYSREGWSFIERQKLVENGPRTSKEALEILKAKPCPKGRKDIIINGSHMALQVHESLGHPVELDRVLGTEAAYAGKSFMTPDLLNNLQYGSKIVNITADATIPHAFGGLAYDDEGVKARRVYLVKDGLFVGYLNSREDSAMLGLEPMGAMRASGWDRMPIVRMVSVNLEPGDQTFDQLVAGIEDGIYFADTLSWSIDDRRWNFQFSTEVGWEIKNGKLGDMVRQPSYQGITPEFWNSCDGIGNKDTWRVWGVPNCGKGEPMQIMHVSHGAPPTRFRNVEVGVGA